MDGPLSNRGFLKKSSSCFEVIILQLKAGNAQTNIFYHNSCCQSSHCPPQLSQPSLVSDSLETSYVKAEVDLCLRVSVKYYSLLLLFSFMYTMMTLINNYIVKLLSCYAMNKTKYRIFDNNLEKILSKTFIQFRDFSTKSIPFILGILLRHVS